MGLKVGIDLGTTYSAVAAIGKFGRPELIPNSDGEHTTPSVIQFFEDGTYIVGSEAKESMELGEYGCASVFKRSMGEEGSYCTFFGRDYTAEDLSAILLKHLKDECEKVTGQWIEEAVVTVPAYFGELQREPTLKAAKRAGLKVRMLVSEPTAAAMNYAADHWRENARILVYDLGGGTFDLTMVQMKKDEQVEVIRTIGNSMLGGRNWDEELAKLMQEKISEDVEFTGSDLAGETLRAAETVKRQLTASARVRHTFDLEDYGSYTVEVTREEFDERTAYLREKTRGLCQNLLGDLGMKWEDVTSVLLVGGSTKMPQIKRFIHDISGRDPLNRVNPDEAVAIGAAIMEGIRSAPYVVQKVIDDSTSKREVSKGGVLGKEGAVSNLQKLSVSDVVAHSMGKVTVNKEGNAYKNQVIVQKNSPIPVKCAVAEQFYTVSGEDNESEIIMLQGDSEEVRDCTAVCRYIVKGIRHDPAKNPTVLRVQYSYDVNGLIHVQARQEDSERDLPIERLPAPADMSRYYEPIVTTLQKVKAEAMRIMLVLDVSGSMINEPMEEAKAAMCRFVDEFSEYPGDLKIGVMAVSDKVAVVQDLTPNLKSVKSAIMSMECCMTGLCNRADPFDELINRMALAKGKKVAVVLTDGVWEKQIAAVERAKRCHAIGINIIGMGFGEADEDFLRVITSGDISSMKVDLSELRVSFGKIAQELGGKNRGAKRRHGIEMKKAEVWEAPQEAL